MSLVVEIVRFLRAEGFCFNFESRLYSCTSTLYSRGDHYIIVGVASDVEVRVSMNSLNGYTSGSHKYCSLAEFRRSFMAVPGFYVLEDISG